MNINQDIESGPGMTRVNSAVQNNPQNLLAVIPELGEVIAKDPCRLEPPPKIRVHKNVKKDNNL